MGKKYVQIRDGAIAWETLDSVQQDGYVEVPAGELQETLKLSGDGTSVEVDDTLKKQQVNLAARNDFISKLRVSTDEQIQLLLFPKTDTRHLMEKMADLYQVVISMKAQLGVDTGSLDQAGQDAFTRLAQAKRDILDPINVLLSDSDGAGFSFVPPFTDVDPLYP